LLRRLIRLCRFSIGDSVSVAGACAAQCHHHAPEIVG